MKSILKYALTGLGATAATAGIGAGVVIPIVQKKTHEAEDKFRKFVSLDYNDNSALANGNFKQTDEQIADENLVKKVNVLALGDSVTAGYTTLGDTDATAVGHDNLSYADYLAKDLKADGRLGEYRNMAVSGATTQDLMETLITGAAQDAVRKSDLITLTIGANDLLQIVSLFGIPYSEITKVLNGDFGKIIGSPMIKAIVSGSSPAHVETAREAFMGESIPKKEEFNRGTFYYNIFKTLEGHGENMLSINVENAKTALETSVTNILHIVKMIHELNPSSHIVFNGYEYPFNRWMLGDKNLTESEGNAAMYRKLGLGTSSFKGTFEAITETIKNQVSQYDFVSWNNFDSNPLVKGDDQSIFQKDLADIHPTEYAQALLGQDIYNKLLVPMLFTNEGHIKNDDFADVKAKVEAAKIPLAGNALISAFVGPDSNENYIAKFNNIIKMLISTLPPYIAAVASGISINLEGPYVTMDSVLDDVFGITEFSGYRNNKSYATTDELKNDPTRLAFIAKMDQVINNANKDLTDLSSGLSNDLIKSWIENSTYADNYLYNKYINTYEYFLFVMKADDTKLQEVEKTLLDFMKFEHLNFISNFMPQIIAKGDQVANATKVDPAALATVQTSLTTKIANAKPNHDAANTKWIELYLDILDDAHLKGNI